MSIDWHRRNKLIRARRQPEWEEREHSPHHPKAFEPTKDVLREPPPLPLTKAQQAAEKRRNKKRNRIKHR